jgi:hypothetical protein
MRHMYSREEDQKKTDCLGLSSDKVAGGRDAIEDR